MGIIATWGTVNLTEVELIEFRIKYRLRIAKLKTIYENPILQYVGTDLKTLEIAFKTWDISKITQVWNERHLYGSSLKNVTLGTVNYNNWYLTTTEIEFLTNDYMTDDLNVIISGSSAVCAVIKLSGIQE